MADASPPQDGSCASGSFLKNAKSLLQPSVLCAGLLLLSAGGAKAQVTPDAFQNFEASPTPTPLPYVISGSGGALVTGTNPASGAPATPFAVEGASGTAFAVTNSGATTPGIVTFDNVSLAGFNAVQVRFRLASFSLNSTGNGADLGDTVTASISTDDGVTFFDTARIIGNSNARYDYSATGSYTTTFDGDNTLEPQTTPTGATGISTVIINVPNGTPQIRLRISALNNANNERWTIDDVRITGLPQGGENRAPVAVDDNFSTTQGQTLTLDAPGVLANDTDADGNTLTVTGHTQPNNGGGSVTVNADGSFTFTPATGFSGQTTFDYTVSDGTLTDTGTVTITVNPPLNIFINEFLTNAPDASDVPNEYVELRGTPNSTIPQGVFLVGVEGDAGTGTVDQVVDLSGLTFGSSGFLLLTQPGNAFPVAPGGNEAEVLPTTPSGGFFENGSQTLLVVRPGSTPVVLQDLDTNNDGVVDNLAFTGANVSDSVGIVESDSDADRSFGRIVFVNSGQAAADNVVAPQATTVVRTASTVSPPGFTADYIARIGDSTGSTASDFVAADLLGTAPNYTVEAGETTPASLGGSPVDHYGATNTFTPPPGPDTTAPTVTSVARASATNPTNAASVDFTVTFSEDVTGVDTTDFTATTDGTLTGATVTNVTGNGSTYTVTVANYSGAGTIRLDVVDDDSIKDAADNTLGAAFNSGETYTITQSPLITRLSTLSGKTGRVVTIDGQYFTDVNDVKFNTTSVAAADIEFISDDKIRVKVPAGATSGPVHVTTPQGTGSSSASFVVDNSAPAIAITSPAANAEVSSLSTVSGTVQDEAAGATGGSGLRQVYVRIRRTSDNTWYTSTGWSASGDSTSVFQATVNGAEGTWSTDASSANLPAGTYLLYAYAADQAGNTGFVTRRVFIPEADTRAPSVTIKSPADNIMVSSLASITGTAGDEAGGSGLRYVYVRIRRTSDFSWYTPGGWSSSMTKATGLLATYNSSKGEWTCSAGPSSLAADTYLVYAYAVDRVGNTNFVSHRVTVSAAGSTSAGTSAAGSSTVKLSSATLQGDAVQLKFTGALEAGRAADTMYYQVLVNGKTVEVESVRYEASSRAVTLSLPAGVLNAGDQVVAGWSDLRDAQGRTLSGNTAPLSVR
jgi:hypothetical protein